MVRALGSERSGRLVALPAFPTVQAVGTVAAFSGSRALSSITASTSVVLIVRTGSATVPSCCVATGMELVPGSVWSTGTSDATSYGTAATESGGRTMTKLPSPTIRPPQPQGANRRLISLVEAALVLGISVASVRRLIWQGRLPVIRLTRRIQVDLRDLDRLIEQAKLRSE